MIKCQKADMLADFNSEYKNEERKKESTECTVKRNGILSNLKKRFGR